MEGAGLLEKLRGYLTDLRVVCAQKQRFCGDLIRSAVAGVRVWSRGGEQPLLPLNGDRRPEPAPGPSLSLGDPEWVLQDPRPPALRAVDPASGEAPLVRGQCRCCPQRALLEGSVCAG